MIVLLVRAQLWRVSIPALFRFAVLVTDEDAACEQDERLHHGEEHKHARHLVHLLEASVGLALFAAGILEEGEKEQGGQDPENDAEEQVEAATFLLDCAPSHRDAIDFAAKVDFARSVCKNYQHVDGVKSVEEVQARAGVSPLTLCVWFSVGHSQRDEKDDGKKEAN